MDSISSTTKFAVSADRACDYIPVVSTLSNLVDLFQKCVVLPLMSRSTAKPSPYYQHLKDKSISRCILLLIPFIGNIIVSVGYNNDSSTDMLKLIRASDEAKAVAAFKGASTRLRGDRDFLIQACKMCPKIFDEIDSDIKDDEDFRKELFQFVNSWVRHYSNPVLGLYAKEGVDLSKREIAANQMEVRVRSFDSDAFSQKRRDFIERKTEDFLLYRSDVVTFKIPTNMEDIQKFVAGIRKEKYALVHEYNPQPYRVLDIPIDDDFAELLQNEAIKEWAGDSKPA